MLKLTLVLAALAFAGATAASAQGWGDRGYSAYEGDGGGHAPYGYDNSTSALGRDCPAGFYPHSWPNGIRCEPVGDTTEFIQGY